MIHAGNFTLSSSIMDYSFTEVREGLRNRDNTYLKCFDSAIGECHFQQNRPLQYAMKRTVGEGRVKIMGRWMVVAQGAVSLNSQRPIIVGVAYCINLLHKPVRFYRRSKVRQILENQAKGTEIINYRVHFFHLNFHIHFERGTRN